MMTTTTRSVGFVLLFLVLFVGGSSSLFFQTTGQESYQCIPRLTMGQLSNLTGETMADMTRFYNQFLPQILIPRLPDTPSHAIVRQYIENEMRQLGWTVERDQFSAQTPFGSKVFTNIVATLKPTTAKRIVFACHYDTKFFEGATNFVGATDSAVPCAILIDTAWKMKQFLQDSRAQMLEEVTPQFIFFDGEEAFVRWTANDSLYGSRHLARKWQNQPDPNDPMASDNLENIDLFVLLDLIGGPNLVFTDFFSNTSSYFYSLYQIEYCLETSRLIPQRPYQRPMFDLWASRRTVVEDDHIPFIHKGVPILHLISTPFPSVWHRPNDDLDHLDPPTIKAFTTIFRVFFFRIFSGQLQ